MHKVLWTSFGNLSISHSVGNEQLIKFGTAFFDQLSTSEEVQIKWLKWMFAKTTVIQNWLILFSGGDNRRNFMKFFHILEFDCYGNEIKGKMV